MRTIVIVLLAAIAVAQFTMPDIGQIGDAIKNEVVSVQQKIEHLTKEEIEAAERKISEGLDMIKGGDNHPEPVKEEETKTAEAQVLPAILVEAAPVVLDIPAETKQVESVSPVESAPAVPVEEPVPAISDNLEPQPKEPKQPGHRQKGHKKGPRRESRSEEESSDDIQDRRRPEHRERKENDQKGLRNKQNKEKRHDYTPEELQKKREEREQRIKEKEERRKAYEKKRRTERDSDSESESDSQERFSRHQRGAEGRKHKDRGQEAKKNALPDVAGLENVQVLTKMAIHP